MCASLCVALGVGVVQCVRQIKMRRDETIAYPDGEARGAGSLVAAVNAVVVTAAEEPAAQVAARHRRLVARKIHH